MKCEAKWTADKFADSRRSASDGRARLRTPNVNHDTRRLHHLEADERAKRKLSFVRASKEASVVPRGPCNASRPRPPVLKREEERPNSNEFSCAKRVQQRA